MRNKIAYGISLTPELLQRLQEKNEILESEQKIKFGVSNIVFTMINFSLTKENVLGWTRFRNAYIKTVIAERNLRKAKRLRKEVSILEGNNI